MADILADLADLYHQLLRWRHCPEGRGASWRSGLRARRRAIARTLQDAPHLRPLLHDAETLEIAWGLAAAAAATETGEKDLPALPPWTVDQILDPAFHPDGPRLRPRRDC